MWSKQIIKVRLQDEFRQFLLSTVYISSKGLNYRIFKDTLKYESYFNFVEDKDKTTLRGFRTTNHKVNYPLNGKENIEFVHYGQ